MRISDAKPGETLYDADGDPWARTAEGATLTCLSGNGKVVEWSEAELSEANERFGPFVSEAPEKVEPNAK